MDFLYQIMILFVQIKLLYVGVFFTLFVFFNQ